MSAQLISENRILLKTLELSCFFEPQTGFLRQVAVGDTEVIRAIYGAVRDPNWNTIQPEIIVNRIETGENHFRLEFQAECSSGEIDFDWHGTIHGKAGTLTFRFAGEAKSTFQKNRIGLCLLHPIRGCAGKQCRARDLGNHWVESEFPRFISPHQPFKALSALSWEVSPGLEAMVTFDGEIFETEDQRNWTDASFKTYCTPLEQPFPIEIDARTQVNQGIGLELARRAGPPTIASEADFGLILVNANEEKSLPSLGICASGNGEALTATERIRFAALELDHLRVDVHFDEPRWRQSLDQATADAKGIGARIQPALFISGKKDLRAFASTVDQEALQGCLIFHVDESSTSEQWLQFASQLLPGIAVVGGTNAYFAELNRQRPGIRFPVAFSINPQVHAFDDLSLIENLEAQPETILSAREFTPFDLYISPITLRPRSNPNATTLAIEPSDRIPFSVDARQRILFGAAWTVGSLARLLPLAGIKSLTYYETIGWKGLMESEQGNSMPDQFDSRPSEIFAVYHVFHALAGATALFPVTNPVPQKIAAVGFRKNGSMHVLLANLEPDPSTVKLRLPATGVAVQILSDDNLDASRKGKLPTPEMVSVLGGKAVFRLPSYSVAILRCL